MICHWEDSDVVVQEVLVNVRRLIIQPRMLPDETYHNLGLSYLHLYRIRRADCMTCLLSPSATRDTPLSYSIAQYNPRDTRLSHILIPISIRIYSLFRRSVGPDPILSGLALPEGMAAWHFSSSIGGSPLKWYIPRSLPSLAFVSLSFAVFCRRVVLLFNWARAHLHTFSLTLYYATQELAINSNMEPYTYLGPIGEPRCMWPCATNILFSESGACRRRDRDGGGLI